MKTVWACGSAIGLIMLAATAVAQEAPYCREYQQQVTIGGVPRHTYGTACLQPDGSWRKMDTYTEQDAAAGVMAQDIEVVQYQPPVYVQQVVYEEPVYYPRAYSRPSYSGIGLSFNFSDRDWHGRRGWHGPHGGHGHGRHP